MQKNIHFTEEEIAVCADAIADGNYASLDANLREHLTICDECAAEVLGVTDIVINQRSEGKGKRFRVKSWIAIASGVAATVLLFFVVSALLTKIPAFENSEVATTLMTESLVERADSVALIPSSSDALTVAPEQFATNHKSNKPKPSDGASYVPDATLEVLFQNHTQEYRGEDITVMSKGILKLSETDSLKWSNPSKEELFVEFFNNKGDRILTLTQKQSGMPIPDLSNGLYYWKLINQDFDLLFVGKIVVD